MAIYDPATDSDKMRALVQLAASIADQLANVAISLAVEAEMLTTRDASQHLQTIAALIKRSATRTDGIARGLLLFSGREPSRPQVISASAVLSDLLPMLRRMVGDSVKLILEYDNQDCLICVDARQIEQIICTLVARARDAMPARGTIKIRVRNLPPSERPDFEADQVCIEIIDTGFAIRSLENIFEPVLTRNSYGLRLGLSTVYGAVVQMSGQITIESTSIGTTFTILLPAAQTRT